MNDSLGDRMKGYEKVTQTKLVRRTPVIIRADGRAFHTFTRGFEKPFDERLIKVMQNVAQKVASKMMNVKFVYVQSDEISFLMTDWDELTTEPYFDNKLQKIVSIVAATTTAEFIHEWYNETKQLVNIQFDARAFNLPKEEVCNYFIWRQQDWTRNSVQMAGRSKFSARELHGVSCNMIQELLHAKHNINWNDYAIYLRRGTAIVRMPGGMAIDKEMPILTQDREYVEEYLK